MNSVEHFIIDRSKWRFGSDRRSLVEKFGPTKMLNGHGYMCCLGQCYRQIGVDDDRMIDLDTPVDVGEDPDKLFAKATSNTGFATKCIKINDNGRFKNTTRETRLTKAFKEKGLTIEFINEYPK